MAMPVLKARCLAFIGLSIGQYIGLAAALAPVMASAQAPAGWSTDQVGCRHWNPAPRPGETLHWTGACVDGHGSGPGTLTWRSAGRPDTALTATLTQGKANGPGTLTYADGSRYEGNLVDSLPNGQGRIDWPDGMRYDGELLAGRPGGGRGVMRFANGNRYEGPFNQGQLSGKAEVTWVKGHAPTRVERFMAQDPATLAGAGNDVVSPRARVDASCLPQYPAAALRAEATGTTTAAFLVSDTGQALKVAITVSSGDTPAHKLLDFATADALWKCPFTPGRVQGKPTEMWVPVDFVWKLK